MELYQNKWCISGSELIISPENPEGLISKPFYDKLCRQHQLKVIRRGSRYTPALVEFASLPRRYQDMIIERTGFDPTDRPNENAIEASLAPDDKAREFFFEEYQLPNGESLPDGAMVEYSTNADLLNTLHKMANTMRGARHSSGRNVRGMWEIFTEALKGLDRSRFPHSLPTHPVRLREKLNRYLKEGPLSLIHRGYGNKIAEKLTDESKRWLLARWCNLADRATSVEHLFELYNLEASVRDWKPLKSVSTIRNYLFDPAVRHLWTGVRHGHLVSKQKYSLQNSTTMPTMRDSLWYSDGTKMNFFYLNDNGKVETCSVYEIIDVYSEVFLGYHVSKHEDYITQFQAYKMAIQFAGCKPYQVSYDNQGGHKKLESGNFLTKLAHLAIRTQPYNGRSKTIENIFGRFQAQVMKRRWFFTGQNITARAQESQAQKEYIAANKHKLPSFQEAINFYIKDRNAWNNAPHPKTGVARIEMYRNSTNPKTRPLQQWEYVNLFWITRPEPVTMTGYGISITEKKTRYDYLVYKDGKPDFEWHRSNVDRKFTIMYDPDDMSLIYLCVRDHKGELRFVREAMTKVTVARGKQEQTSADHAWLKMMDEANKIGLIKERDYIAEVLDEFEMSPENYGLVLPGIPGVTKKTRTTNVGRIDKAISNLVAIDEEEEEKNLYDLM